MNVSFNIKISDSNANIIILSAVAIFIAILIIAYIMFMIYKKVNKNKNIKEGFDLADKIDDTLDDNLNESINERKKEYREWWSKFVGDATEKDISYGNYKKIMKTEYKEIPEKGNNTLLEWDEVNDIHSLYNKYENVRCLLNDCGSNTKKYDTLSNDDMKVNNFVEEGDAQMGNCFKNFHPDGPNSEYKEGDPLYYWCPKNDGKIEKYFDVMDSYIGKKIKEMDKEEEEEEKKQEDNKDGFISKIKGSIINNFSNTNTLSKKVIIEDNIRPVESKKYRNL